MELKAAPQYVKAQIGDEDYFRAYIILEELLSITKKDIILGESRQIDDVALKGLKNVIAEVNLGKPLAYVFNKAYFLGLEFYVDERVLIPRYDTEISVEVILSLTKGNDKILEIGAGSGCVAISLAKNLPQSEVKSCDVSKDALAVARINQEIHQVKNVTFLHSDLFNAIEEDYDIIYSNPPYITLEEMDALDKSVKGYEPHLALEGGEDGLVFYRRIIDEAPFYLRKKGYLVFEIGSTQADAVVNLMRGRGFQDISVKQDLNRLDRVVYGRLSDV